MSLVAAAPNVSLSARSLRLQRPRLAVMSIGEGVRERVQGVRVPGTLTVAPGADATRSLDTCPTPSWDPAASPELGCSGGWRLGALGDGVGRLGGCRPRRRGLFAWGGGAYWGTPESSQATGPRGVALWEGRCMWMAAAVAWSASNPASCCQRRQRCGRVLALGTARRQCGLVGRGPK